MRLSLTGLLPCFWRGVGWFGVALLIYLSLAPMPAEIPIEHGDKLGHALAYAVLMCWWAQLLTTPQEVLDCFLRTKMDLLVMGEWVVERE